MILRTPAELDHRSGTRIRRCVGRFLASCFFLGVVSLAMHHHNAFFQPKGCAICKAKTSFSSTLNKVKADTPLSMATVNHYSEEICFIVSQMNCHPQAPFIASLLPNPFLNKAPPFIS
jgi:hypothetical protein